MADETGSVSYEVEEELEELEVELEEVMAKKK